MAIGLILVSLGSKRASDKRKFPLYLLAGLALLISTGCQSDLLRELTPATMGDVDRAVDGLEEQHDATWEAAADTAEDALLAGKTAGEASLDAIRKGKEYSTDTKRDSEEGNFSALLWSILGVLGVGGVGTAARYKQATGKMPFASVLSAVFKPTTEPEKPKRKRSG